MGTWTTAPVSMVAGLGGTLDGVALGARDSLDDLGLDEHGGFTPSSSVSA